MLSGITGSTGFFFQVVPFDFIHIHEINLSEVLQNHNTKIIAVVGYREQTASDSYRNHQSLITTFKMATFPSKYYLFLFFVFTLIRLTPEMANIRNNFLVIGNIKHYEEFKFSTRFIIFYIVAIFSLAVLPAAVFFSLFNTDKRV